MKRLPCVWLLATAMVFALAPTAVFADPPCPPGQCFKGNSDVPADSCDNNGCTKLNNPGNKCFDAPGNKCG